MQLSLAFAQQPDKLSFEVKSERAQNEEKQGYETSRKRRRKRTAVLYRMQTMEYYIQYYGNLSQVMYH